MTLGLSQLMLHNLDTQCDIICLEIQPPSCGANSLRLPRKLNFSNSSSLMCPFSCSKKTQPVLHGGHSNSLSFLKV